MNSLTIISIFLHYETFLDYPTSLDDVFINYQEKFCSLISQMIWFFFWMNARNYLATVLSGIIIFILILFLSCAIYVNYYRRFRYISVFLGFFVMLICLFKYFWKDTLLYGSLVLNLGLSLFYISKLYEFINSYSNKDKLKRFSYCLSITNIIINIIFIIFTFSIKLFSKLLTIPSFLDIIIFSIFIIIRYNFQKLEKEEDLKIMRRLIKIGEQKREKRKKIQEGKCRIITCKPSEEGFIFDNYPIVYKRPKDICDCTWKMFVDIDENNLTNKINDNIFIFESDSKKDYFLKQTNAGNCFLVSSIMSIINIPDILDYLVYFEDLSKDNYTDKDEEISLYCYIRGIRTIINIKNTFPSFKNEVDSKKYMNRFGLNENLSPIPCTTSKNGVLLGQTLIKAFICLNYLKQDILNKIDVNTSDKICLTYNEKDDISTLNDENYILSKKINIMDTGLLPEYPMNIFIGCISEIIYRIDLKSEDDKNNIIKKIIKYMNLGGFIQICKWYKNGSGHAFTLQGYIELKEKRNTFYFSVINPHKGNDSFEKEEFSEENIKEMKVPYYENKENEDIIAKISYINQNYIKTGHMILKDEIFLEWMDFLNFSESMFGATELIFFIKENDPIEIEVNKASKICIDICSTQTKLNPHDMDNYINFELNEISDEKDLKKVELTDKTYINKIYEELNKGKYKLKFKINSKNNKDSFRCRIKYYKEDINIKEKENMEAITNFSKVRQFNTLSKKVFDLFSRNQFKNIENIEVYLPDSPKDNKIAINYDNNNTLYWVENQDAFEHLNYKSYSINYKEYTVITLVNLLYFVPIFKIICYKNENKFKVITPGNESLILDEEMNILEISDKLKKIPKLAKYQSSKSEQNHSESNRYSSRNSNYSKKNFIMNFGYTFFAVIAIFVYVFGYFILNCANIMINLVKSITYVCFESLKYLLSIQNYNVHYHNY